MGVKLTERASAKAQRKLPVKKSKKTTRAPKAKKSTDSKVGDIGAAILAMTDRMTDRMAASKAETDAAIQLMSARMEKNSADVVKIIEAMKQDQEKTNRALHKTTQDLSEKLNKTMQEMSENLNKTTADSSEKLNKTMQELSENLNKTTTDLSEKLNKTTRELSEKLNKTTGELSENLNKTTRELSESIHDIDGNVGGVNRRLGKIVEMVVLPGLMEKMNKDYSHQFDNVAPNKKFTADGQLYAEMDLFLENGDSVMAVEAKTRLTEGMVNTFVQKLESLRQHEVKAGLVGKTIYAAIAGIIFDDNARKAASEKGIYLVSINQNNDKINIEPLTRPAGKW
jgi:hypothetical protein